MFVPDTSDEYNQCGEVSYRNDVALQLEKIINETKNTLT